MRREMKRIAAISPNKNSFIRGGALALCTLHDSSSMIKSGPRQSTEMTMTTAEGGGREMEGHDDTYVSRRTIYFSPPP